MKEMNYITKQEMVEKNLEKRLYNNQTIKIPLAKLYLLLFVVIRRCFKRQQKVNLYTKDITQNAVQKAKLHN